MLGIQQLRQHSSSWDPYVEMFKIPLMILFSLIYMLIDFISQPQSPPPVPPHIALASIPLPFHLWEWGGILCHCRTRHVSSTTEVRQDNQVKGTGSTGRQQNPFKPPFQLLAMPMKTKLQICYICTGILCPALVCSLVDDLVSGSAPTVKANCIYWYFVESLPPQVLQRFPALFHKTSWAQSNG